MLGLVEINATFVFQIVNVIIIYVALRHFLFKPVTEFMAKRTASIEASMGEAESRNNESDELRAKYEAELKEIRDERNAIIEEATKIGQAKGDEIILAAQEQSEKIKEKAKLDIEREKQKMMNELKADISMLAIAAAEKIIEKDLDEATHQQMIQQFIDKAGEAQWQN